MPDPGASDDHLVLQQLAVAQWSESAAAEVVSVTVVGNRAEVQLLIDGDYEYWQYFERLGRAWQEAIGGNAPCAGWDDPTAIHWFVEPDGNGNSPEGRRRQ